MQKHCGLHRRAMAKFVEPLPEPCERLARHCWITAQSNAEVQRHFEEAPRDDRGLITLAQEAIEGVDIAMEKLREYSGSNSGAHRAEIIARR